MSAIPEQVLPPLAPARRLWPWSGRRRLPLLRQQAGSDCGPTCLAMVLAFHGRWLSRPQIDALLPPGRDGYSALTLLEAARSQGLTGRGLRLEAGAVNRLRPGSILHWRGNHFVVYEGPAADGVRINDPARGRRLVDSATLAAQFSGLALELWPGEDFQPQARPGQALGRYLAILAEGRRLLGGTLVLSLILLGFSLLLPLLTVVVVDRLIPAGQVSTLLLVLIGSVLLVAGQGLTFVIRGLLLVRLHEHFDRRTVTTLTERLLALPYGFFQQRSVGDLVMRLGSTAQVREALTGGTLSAVMDGLLLVIYLGLLLALSPLLTLVAVVLAGLHLGVFAITRRQLADLTAWYLACEAESRGFQSRMLMGIETLKATGSEGEAAARHRQLFDNVLEASRQRGRFNAWQEGVRDALRLLGPVVLLGVGAHEVITGGMTLGVMLGALQLALSFLIPLTALIATAVRLTTVAGHLERLEEIHTAEPEPAGGGIDRPVSGAVELQGVSFRYGPTSPWILEGLDLTVPAGSHVAIVGPSGSGKSTLARLLLGLSFPQQGRVCFDGIPLEDWDLGALRRQLGVVTQEASLFNLPIADNIALGSPIADRQAIEAAARTARIHDEIIRLPMGYDTRLTDGGSTLSGGQRQRLTLARALVRRPRLLVLDEATSALDSVTESAIQQALDQLNCTVVTIAHRLSTVQRADLILVMDGGRIVERGSHRELLTRGGPYRQLIEAQLPGDQRHV